MVARRCSCGLVKAPPFQGGGYGFGPRLKYLEMQSARLVRPPQIRGSFLEAGEGAIRGLRPRQIARNGPRAVGSIGERVRRAAPSRLLVGGGGWNDICVDALGQWLSSDLFSATDNSAAGNFSKFQPLTIFKANAPVDAEMWQSEIQTGSKPHILLSISLSPPSPSPVAIHDMGVAMGTHGFLSSVG